MAFDGSLDDSGTAERGSPQRKAALLLALRFYRGALANHKSVAIPGLLLPAIGDIFVFYLPPIIVARILGRLADGEKLSAGVLTPYVLLFAGILAIGEVCWRVGIHCLNRTDGRGIEDLYVQGMDALLAKDAAFFHDNCGKGSPPAGTHIFYRALDRFLHEGVGHIASPALHALELNCTGKEHARVRGFVMSRIGITYRDLQVHFREFACKILCSMCSSQEKRAGGSAAAAPFVVADSLV